MRQLRGKCCVMLHDIKVARQLGADGVVFGCLTAEGNVDVPLMQKLMNAVGEMSVTFHRAFDMCSNPKEALEQIIGLGIDRVLTSGQEATAEKGIPLLKELVELADGRIIIMPGCGVNAGNIRKIAEETGTSEFHFSGRSSVDSGYSGFQAEYPRYFLFILNSTTYVSPSSAAHPARWYILVTRIPPG